MTVTTLRSLLRIIGLAVLLYLIFDALFIVVKPFDAIEPYTIYGTILPLKSRLFDTDVILTNGSYLAVPLDTAFRANIISRPKAADEFRVALLGDSSVLGRGDSDDGTISSLLNSKNGLVAGKRVIVYNLGWPIPDFTKDLLIADRSLQYAPDLFIWMINPMNMTYTSPPRPDNTAVIESNSTRLAAIAAKTGLNTLYTRYYGKLVTPWWQNSIIFKRDGIMAWLRYQRDGFDSTTEVYKPLNMKYLTANQTGTFLSNHQIGALAKSDDWKVLLTLPRLTSAPVLYVNEPILVVPAGLPGAEANYDSSFARDAYDAYRSQFHVFCGQQLWCIDLWNLVPPQDYTDTTLHKTKQGNALIADQLFAALTARYSGNRP